MTRMIVSAEIKQVLTKEVNIGQVSIVAKKGLKDYCRQSAHAWEGVVFDFRCPTVLGAAMWSRKRSVMADISTQSCCKKQKGNKQKTTEQKQRLAARG